MQFFVGNQERYQALGCSQEPVLKTESMILEGNENWQKVPVNEKHTIFWSGDCFYCREGEQTISSFQGKVSLQKIFSNNTLNNAISMLEGSFMGVLVDNQNKSATLFTDSLGRVEMFYARKGNDLLVASDLGAIARFMGNMELDPIGVSNVLILNSTPKKHTVYKNVKRLGVGEKIVASNKGFTIEKFQPKLKNIVPYGESDLERYWDIVKNSFCSRASSSLNWVMLSSGWDSTFALSLLVKEFGPDRVRAVTIKADNSNRVGAHNLVEVERAQKIAQYFGVKHDVLVSGISSTDVLPLWKQTSKTWSKKHIFGHVPFAQNLVARHVKKNEVEGQVVFNMDCCDSLHNFGFSQYISTMHSDFNFREYGDKMLNYLYGPSFINCIEDGTYDKDTVFKIIQFLNGPEKFEDVSKLGRTEKLQSYLFPLFFGGTFAGRLPFYRSNSHRFLTETGGSNLYQWGLENYINPVINEIKAENIYSGLTWLYHQFHLQGTTIRSFGAGMEEQGVPWRLPFSDGRVVDFLSQMPESWGRGLNFAHTKYPLKWAALNKLDYPMDILWGGKYGMDNRSENVHSYLMERGQGMTVPVEMLCFSGLTDYFKELLTKDRCDLVLDNNAFDKKYFERIISDYKDKNEVKTEDANTMFHLCYLLDRLLV